MHGMGPHGEKSDLHLVRDDELLRRFIAVRDQAAFAELIRRHGPLVLYVCRRILHHAQDTEDAFQATFLALSLQAATIKRGVALPSWLHRVATRVAQDQLRQNTRRLQIMSDDQLSDLPQRSNEELSDLLIMLDDELERLPAKYRSAILLCDYYGYSCKRAAKTLELPVGTLQTNLRRGRELLRKRVLRHGVTVSVAGISSTLAGAVKAAGPVPPELIQQTTRSSLSFLAGQTSEETTEASNVFHLAESTIRRMKMSKLLSTSTLCLAIGIFAFAVPILSWNSLVRAQPYFFVDDFEDGDPFDGEPVTWVQWTGGVAETGEVIDGDFVLRLNGVDTAYYPDKMDGSSTVRDSSIRAQVRFLESNRSTIAMVTARDTELTAYVGGIWQDGSLAIWRYSNAAAQVLREIRTPLDPVARDVLVQFDVFGNKLSLTAWLEGDAMPDEPQIVVFDDAFSVGGVSVGLAHDQRIGGGGPSEVAFRHVAVVPEPTSAMLGGMGLASLGALMLLSRKVRGRSLISQ